MKLRLFKHQKKALRLMKRHPHFALFLEMGCGKTLIAIKDIERRFKWGQITRAVIFAPKSILFNWVDEIHKFLDIPRKSYIVETLDYPTKKKRMEALKEFYEHNPNNLKVEQLRKVVGPDSRKMNKSELIKHIPQKLQILIINYEKSRVMLKELKRFKPEYLTVDEAHKLRNRNAQISKNIYRFTRGCKYRYIMTGTPVCNGFEDVYMQYKIMDEDILGTNYKDFEEDFIVKGGYMGYEIVGYQNEDELREIIKNSSYRVKIGECIDLPEQLPNLYLHCDLNPKAQKIYNQMDKDMVADLEILQEQIPRSNLKSILRDNSVYYRPQESYLELFLKASTYINKSSVELLMTKVMRLQQIAGGFIKNDSGSVINVSRDKLQLAKDFVEEYKKPLVIFCQYIPEIEMLSKELSKLKRGKHKVRVKTLTGKSKDKAKLNKKFQAGKIDVLILQLKAGSVGLNLYRASRMMFYSWNHSYDDYVQAIARIKRNGQKEPWQIIHLIANNTVDKHILDSILDKGKIAKKLID